jgi:hypothetical protein
MIPTEQHCILMMVERAVEWWSLRARRTRFGWRFAKVLYDLWRSLQFFTLRSKGMGYSIIDMLRLKERRMEDYINGFQVHT